jgi:hypothetical protein
MTPQISPLRLVLALLLATSALAAPPKVIRATPRPGAQDVDPHLRFIRVEFDQDMQVGAHSWVGGGPQFPKLRCAPYWESARVAVLAVELEPNHDYWLSVNNPNFRNFASRQGEPAEPYPLAFRTGGPRPAPDPVARAKEENRLALDQLRRVIDEHYAYRDLRKLDWDKLFEDYASRMRKADSPERFAELTGRLLAHAEDVHITVRYDGKPYRSFVVHSRPNANVNTLMRVVPNWQKRSNNVATGEWPDGIRYLLIGTWSRELAEQLRPAVAALEQLGDAPGLIIDVRMNSGGDETLAREIAGFFVSTPQVYSRNRYRNPNSADGFTDKIDRTLPPRQAGRAYPGHVAVLMGPANMSSNESFLLMMRQAARCVLVGEKSYGSSGNPQEHCLPNGVQVYLPSWQDFTPTGKLLEGAGVTPDIRVPGGPEAFTKQDPVLEAALRRLRAEIGGQGD